MLVYIKTKINDNFLPICLVSQPREQIHPLTDACGYSPTIKYPCEFLWDYINNNNKKLYRIPVFESFQQVYSLAIFMYFMLLLRSILETAQTSWEIVLTNKLFNVHLCQQKQ